MLFYKKWLYYIKDKNTGVKWKRDNKNLFIHEVFKAIVAPHKQGSLHETT